MKKRKKEKLLKGIGVSPGVVIGPVYLFLSENISIVEHDIPVGRIEHEICRLENALIETRRQLKAIQSGLEKMSSVRDACILDAHLMVLDDRAFIDEVISDIKENKKNAESVVKKVSDNYASTLASLKDDYLRERVADVKDVARRILRNLGGGVISSLAEMDKPHILVATDLDPSETAQLRKDMVIGLATDLGSPTSHTAVMARALDISAIVGLHDVTRSISAGDEVLIDGNRGIMVINPTSERLKRYGKLAENRKTVEKGLDVLKDEPAKTSDGHAICLSANLESLEDIDSVKEYGAEGVGLFRSEYLFLAKEKMVSEDDQFQIYSDVAKKLAPAPVIIRTIDIGGDKILGGTEFREANPFLGCRSIRFSLANERSFKEQIRAVLRASESGNIKIMFPMISNLSEVQRSKEILDECKKELRKKKIAFDNNIDVGVMIEIPAAAIAASTIAKHVDFFSIGTNDLIQYTLAVDRGNEMVAYLYEPTHPAVLQLIEMTIKAAHDNGIWVGVCGEMAADPLLAPLLVGLGVDELSMAPSAVPMVKDSVRSISLKDAKQLASKSLSCDFAEDVLVLCKKSTKEFAPELLELL